jgi:subtilisin family serine protease/subtilisin-like proprotein convertase family protein
MALLRGACGVAVLPAGPNVNAPSGAVSAAKSATEDACMARQKPAAPKAPRTPRRRPQLETLEDRTLFNATAGVTINPSAYSPSDILVQFRTAEPPQSVLSGTTIGTALNAAAGLYEVDLQGSVTVEQALAAYRASPAVASAEPDYYLIANSIPNDPQFGQQWYLNNTGQTGGTPGADIHAVNAWNTTTSSSTLIAQMDTGVDYDHPDLYQSIWINQAEIPTSRMKNLVDVDHDGLITFADLNNPINQGAFKITDVNHDGIIDAADILAPMVLNAQGQDTGQGGWAYPGNTQDGDLIHPNDFIGWNFVNNTNNPLDDNGHGTEVAGIIGAQGNNGVGIAGIDWQAQIMSVKFLDASGSGSVSNFIAGLNYAVAHGAKISNNSWDGASYSTSLYQAIANAQSHGMIFVAAAGNEASNNDTTPTYPAGFALNNIVSVTATDQNDNLAGFSNYGGHSISLAAPGVNVFSTLPGKSYGSLSGTSASVPQVTAVLALVWGQHPTWSYTQVINQVLTTVDPLASLAGKTITGGRLDAAAALGLRPRILTASSGGPEYNTLSSVRVTFNEPISPATFTPADVLLKAPNGNPITINAVNPVSGSGNTQFDILFATQTAGGNYTMQIGPNVTDAGGNQMVVFNWTFNLKPTYTYTSTPAMTITPQTYWTVSSLNIPQSMPIGKVILTLNLTYSNDSDLYIHLQAPDGTDILLSNRRGGSGANFQTTLFDDQAATSITAGQAPFNGSFRPEVSLGNLITKSTLGNWKLWIENRGGTGSGILNSWSLSFIP